MDEPIKCPFCGRTPTVEDCGTNRWFVRCQCGIAQDKLYHQRCDAVRAWNRRKSIQPDVPDTNVGDTISRQAAIEHLKKRLYETALNNVTEHPYYEEMADNRVSVWLKEVPSAQPEQIARDIATIIENEKDMRVILNAPSAQSEIIRCKDCMHNGSFDTDCPIDWNGKEYCSFAERKEDE